MFSTHAAGRGASASLQSCRLHATFLVKGAAERPVVHVTQRHFGAMLGLSLSKILFTVMLVLAVWKGWRLLSVIRDKISDPPADQVRQRPSHAPPSRPKAETLYECPHCHTYVPNGTICRSKEHCVLKQG